MFRLKTLLHAKFLECNLNLNGRSKSIKKKKERSTREEKLKSQQAFYRMSLSMLSS